MKKGVLLFILLLIQICATAQLLPVNAKGKWEVSDVVIVEALPKSQLYSNEVNWMNQLIKNDGKLSGIHKDSLEGTISGDYEFLVYSQTGILRKISGAVTYQFSVETKEGKYRYTFSDFIFHYYHQDRNYKMVSTGKTRGFEEMKAAGWQKLWSQHQQTVTALVNQQIAKLKTEMVENPAIQKAKPTEKKVDW